MRTGIVARPGNARLPGRLLGRLAGATAQQHGRQPEAADGDAPAATERGRRLRLSPWRALRWLRRNAYLAVAAGAVLVATRAVDFSPPPEVRVGKGDVAQLVGDAPPQEFSAELTNPQAVQDRKSVV